jgi:multicomponent Na+:H+ antiporter subunit F
MMLEFAVQVTMVFLSLGVVLSLIRLVVGPTLPDRVVALDLIASLSIGMVALYSISSGESAFLDVAIVISLLAFLGTIAFAYYIERRSGVSEGDD